MKQIVYGSQEFLDRLKDAVNKDTIFRDLAKEDYNANELIIVKDLGIGLWQRTINGEIKEFMLIPKKKITEYEKQAEIVYYIDSYNSLVDICREGASFIQMIIDGQIDVKGDMKKLKRIQAASERMELIMKKICKDSLILSKEEYIRLLLQKNYL
jgi:hypothetical protein